jgi:hypothetical protein
MLCWLYICVHIDYSVMFVEANPEASFLFCSMAMLGSWCHAMMQSSATITIPTHSVQGITNLSVFAPLMARKIVFMFWWLCDEHIEPRIKIIFTHWKIARSNCLSDSKNDWCARYPPHGRRTVVLEDGVQWDRVRAPPVNTLAHDLHASDCLHELRPGDHIEIQWRRNKEFPYGMFPSTQQWNACFRLCQWNHWTPPYGIHMSYDNLFR